MSTRPSLQQLMENFHPEPNIDVSVKVSINLLCGEKQTSDLHDLDRYHLLTTARLWLLDGDRAREEPGLLALLRLLGLSPGIDIEEVQSLLETTKGNLAKSAW